MPKLQRITDRIYDIAAAALPRHALGLEPTGLDVAWGNWTMPQGQGKKETYAILFTFRAMGPRGEVLLGDVPPITNAYILSGLWPPETEIENAVREACNIVRQYIQGQGVPQNGQGPQVDVFKEAMRRFNEGKGGQG